MSENKKGGSGEPPFFVREMDYLGGIEPLDDPPIPGSSAAV